VLLKDQQAILMLLNTPCSNLQSFGATDDSSSLTMALSEAP
jgi:hypothetical protein